jgi:hypothetical protein
MTLERRVTKLETSLSPTQLVLRWLAEAHAYGDIQAYVASLLDNDLPMAPLDRLAREAVQGRETPTEASGRSLSRPRSGPPCGRRSFDSSWSCASMSPPAIYLIVRA